VVRFSLLNRIGNRSSSGAAPGPQPVFRRAPSPGALRRERRAIVKAREERIRHLGGLTLEMYRRSSFRDQLLIEQCREIIALEDRLRELDSMLEAVATVDGLDVSSGRPGSFDRRGYVLDPRETLRIEGFRRSMEEVAAFRFGAVSDSYAAEMGDDRNVGPSINRERSVAIANASAVRCAV